MLPAESAWWADIVKPHFPVGYDGTSLTAFGIDGAVLDWAVERLSSGERQRLALARLLAIRPKVLLLDEPTASLDADNVDRMEGLLSRYRADEEAAVLWVSHDIEQAHRVASRHFELCQGRLEGR